MKKLLLAATILAGLAGPASAQWITHDPKSDLQRTLEFGRSIQQQYEQARLLTSQVTSTARNVGSGNIGAAMGGLSSYGLPSASTMTGLLGGRGNIDNSRSYVQRDRVYQPGQRDEWAVEMERREYATANANALIERGMRNNEEDVRRMTALEQQLSATNTVVDAELLGVELNGFRERQEGHRRTLASVDTMLTTANRTDQLRAEQRQRRDADAMAERYSGGTAGGSMTARSAPSGFLGY